MISGASIFHKLQKFSLQNLLCRSLWISNDSSNLILKKIVMEHGQGSHHRGTGVVEADADVGGRPPQRFPWEEAKDKPSTQTAEHQTTSYDSKPEEKISNNSSSVHLTKEERDKLMMSLGKMTSWLAGKSCHLVAVPPDLRKLVEELPGSKEFFKEGKPVKFLDRLLDLGALSADFKEEFLSLSPQSQKDKMDVFFYYLFRKGMRAVLNFAKVLYEDKKELDVIKIVEHIDKRGYIPQDNVLEKAEKAGYIPESSTTPTNVEVRKGRYSGGARIYPMSSYPKGYVLIINNENFQQYRTIYGDRTGTAVDGDSLGALFTQLGFHIYDGQQHFNKTKKEMETLTERFAKDKCHEAVHASVVCILSHGTKNGNIAGVDGEYTTDTTIERFFTASSCPSLANKPKLFFFVACRGNEIDNGSKLSQEKSENPFPFLNSSNKSSPSQSSSNIVADAAGGDAMRISSNVDVKRTREEDPQKIPDFSDFLTVYATVPGYRSLRNTQMGTWFVQEFVKVVSEEACLNDLLTMMAEVNNRVSLLTSYDGEKQTLETSTRLRKCLFFNPGF